MQIRGAEDLMIRSVLVMGFMLSGLPAYSGVGQPPALAIRDTMDTPGINGDNWKAAALKALSLKIDGNGSGSLRSVVVVIDRAALLAELPMLQEHGALSKSITSQEMAKQPASYTNAISLLLTSCAVRRLYEARPELDRTRWNVSLAGPAGVHGQDTREIYSFGFDRPLYARKAWDQLPFTEFPTIADRFSYNLRFTLDMSREVSGSIDDD